MTHAELIETDMMFIQTQEIFKLLDRKLFDKIPEKIKNYIVNYHSINNYSFTYDTSKRLSEQTITKDTRRLIAYIDYYYWASNDDKVEIQNAWNINESKENSNKGINSLFSEKNNVHEAMQNIEKDFDHEGSIIDNSQKIIQAPQGFVQEQSTVNNSQGIHSNTITNDARPIDIAIKKEGFFSKLFSKLFKRR